MRTPDIAGDGVQPDTSSAKPAGNPLDPVHVLAEHRARQAVHIVIGDRDGLVLGVVGDGTEDRAEDFFPRDAHVVGHVGEQGRLDIPAVLAGERRQLFGWAE